MSIFLILSIYIGLSVALIYTLLCGDSDYHRDGLVGSLYRFLTHGLCQCIKKGCSKMCGERLIRKFGAVEHYCCNTPNPILQIVYLVLVIGGYYLFLKDAAPLIPNSYVPGYHNYAVTIFMLLVLGVFFACYFVDAGSVTRNNVEVHMKSYPYDYLVYSKKTCTTCNITRPARSKHCAICNRCVARFDHHCPWINNCVAEYNQAYFLAFLWGTATLCLYGCYLCTMTLWAVVDERGMLTLQAKDKQGKLYPVSNIVLFQYIVQNTGMLFPLALFCIIISLVLYGFFLYHVYLVVKNTTTNESFKWSDLRRTQKRCKEYKRDHEEYMKTVQETTSDSPQDSNNSLARMESPMKRKPPQPDEKGGPFTKFNIEEIEAMCNKELTNIYNKGILHNFMEVLFPMSKRHKHSKRQ